jgi:N-acetylglutamate synthase-like GNAT family acetyltransferase
MNRCQVRRATVEDLPQLRPLWELESLRCDDLEKRLTEFQVVDDGAGQVLAAIGLQMAEGQGKLHSEAIAFFDQAEAMRALLWPRLESVARNHGLARLWTCLQAPFWRGVGFKKVSDETLASLPASFAEENAAWLQWPLRSAEADSDVIEKQLAVLKAMSQAENERMLDRARVMRWIAISLITLIFGAFAVWVVYWTRVWPRLKRRRQGNG